MATQAPPWHRQPGEPSKWFDRFARWRDAGPQRSMLLAYKRENARNSAAQTVPASWRDAAAKWDWHARADAFDRAEAARIEQERREVRDKRRRLLEDAEWRRANGLLSLADRVELELAAMVVLGRSVRRASEREERDDDDPAEVDVTREVDACRLLAELRRLTLEGLDLARRAVGLPATIAAEVEESQDAPPAGPTHLEITVKDFRAADTEQEPEAATPTSN